MKDLTTVEFLKDDVDRSEVFSFLMDLGIVTDYASEYGEPGYRLDNPEGCFIIGSWWCNDRNCDYNETYDNGDKRCHDVLATHYPTIERLFEAWGVEMAFYDEWWIDSNNDKAYRTQPDSYSWQSSLLYCDGDYLTPDDDISSWVEVCLENEQGMGSKVWSRKDLEAIGFQVFKDELEDGWYPGQNDDPATEVAKVRRIVGEDADILPYLDSTGQFDIRYSILVRKGGWEDRDAVEVEWWSKDGDDPDAWVQTTCEWCGLDIEGQPSKDNWHDRGGNRSCGPNTDTYHTPYDEDKE